MKAIKITEANAAAIEAALKQVNGRAEQHAYTTFGEIENLAAAAEKKLLGLVFKKDAAGASYRETSGGKVPNSYKQSRNATSVTLIRKSAGWYLASATATTVWGDGGGNGSLTLTQEQAEAAVAIFKKQFRVAK